MVSRTSPFVTVVTPALNERSTLPPLERSLAGQGLDSSSIEWVVVDDGSTDGTTEWLTKGPWRVRPTPVLVARSGGPGAARNLGIDHASAPLITFVDADDSLEPGALGAWLDAMRRTPADVLLTPTPLHLSARRRAQLGTRPRVLMEHERWSGNLLRDWLTPGKLYRRDFVRDASLRFNTAPEAEDLCFFVSAMLRAQRVAVAPQTPSYTYERPHRSAAQRPPSRPEESLAGVSDALRAIRAAAPRDFDWLPTASPVLAGLSALYLRALRFAPDHEHRNALRQQVREGLTSLDLQLSDLAIMDRRDVVHSSVALLAMVLPARAAQPLAAAWVTGLASRRTHSVHRLQWREP